MGTGLIGIGMDKGPRMHMMAVMIAVNAIWGVEKVRFSEDCDFFCIISFLSVCLFAKLVV